IRFHRRKALALLAYLAVSESPQTREKVAAILWPEVPTDRSLANLRNTIYTIRKLSGTELLANGGNDLQLLTSVSVDVREFRGFIRDALDPGCRHSDDVICATCLRGLGRAVNCASEPFMAGFSVRESPEFEQWQLFEFQSLQHALRRAICALLDVSEARHEWATAVTYGRYLLAADPLDETANRRMMRILFLAGHRGDALRQYETLVRNLREELDIEPDSETIEVAEAIRTGELEIKHAAKKTGERSVASGETNPATSPVSGLPCPATLFIGRRKELARLQELLADSAHRVITLTGPGGVGKTRLAIAAAQDARTFFRDGIAWVPMASVEAADSIYPVLARCLGLRMTHSSVVSDTVQSPDLF
nr:BTAD domain-containing putative transcriptional regulator [bacterium]